MEGFFAFGDQSRENHSSSTPEARSSDLDSSRGKDTSGGHRAAERVIRATSEGSRKAASFSNLRRRNMNVGIAHILR